MLRRHMATKKKVMTKDLEAETAPIDEVDVLDDDDLEPDDLEVDLDEDGLVDLDDDDPLDDLSDAFQLLSHSHRDMIATTAFNYYGDRFATGSVDGKIKVYNKNNTGNWVLCDTWGAHNAEVYQVHPPPSTFEIIANEDTDPMAPPPTAPW